MVTIENLSFAFKRNLPLFTDLNLELEIGNIYGLFGLNGAGKTTLLNHITGMLFPESGECRVLGQPARDRLPEVLKEIFMIPEQFELPPMTGHRYLKIHAPFYPRFDFDLFDRLLKEFEVNPVNKIPSLSYGERKKFLIAFALATQSRLLLMDEPTNGLDIPSKSQFRKIIASIDNSNQCTVISTHQVRDLGAMIDHITVIKDGMIIFKHGIDEIMNRLTFEKLDENDTKPYLYGEEILGGLKAICPAASGEKTSEIDLELLFNGIIQYPEKINREFHHESS